MSDWVPDKSKDPRKQEVSSPLLRQYGRKHKPWLVSGERKRGKVYTDGCCGRAREVSQPILENSGRFRDYSVQPIMLAAFRKLAKKV